MNIIYKILLKFRNYSERKFSLIKHIDCEKRPQVASDMIYDLLISEKPCMISRLGGVELHCLTNYLGVKKGPFHLFRFITGKSDAWWWIPKRIFEMKNNAGFFSADDPKYIERFCKLLLDDISYIDILGSWQTRESYISDRLVGAKKVLLPFLEPYWGDQPWSRALQGKKVLVVHPFAQLIEKQYHNNRTKLFVNPDVLQPFQLKTLKSVQSIGGISNGFSSWFDALDWMKNEIDKIDYDICIIGCGAYGLHLAAHVKRQGKKAIHLGGATQLMFGIKGKRWEDPMYGVNEWNIPTNFYVHLFNGFWVKPDASFRPDKADSVEGACYW